MHIIRYKVCSGRQIISPEFVYEKDERFYKKDIV